MISIKEIAWAAAFYEGEGNVRKDKKCRGLWSGITVSIPQKDRWCLDKLRFIFGFGRISEPRPNGC